MSVTLDGSGKGVAEVEVAGGEGGGVGEIQDLCEDFRG